MNIILINMLKRLLFISVLLFCNLARAEYITISTADIYPYKNLIERTDTVKVFYIKNDGNLSCRVEVLLGNMKWASAKKKISKEFFNHAPLSNCLSRETAEKILLQTFLQFGKGL